MTDAATTTTFYAGQRVTASQLQALVPKEWMAVKTASESVTSSTTYQSDDELTFTNLVSGGTYRFEGEIYQTGAGGNADIKIRWIWPSTGATGHFSWLGIGLHVDWSDGANGRDVQVVGGQKNLSTPSDEGQFATNAGQNRPVLVKGRFFLATAGSFTMEWAQVTSSATATQVLAGSWVKLTRES